MNIIDIIILLLPLLSGFITGKIVGLDSTAGKNINARPPGFVFGIAWTILYLLIGISWVITRQKQSNNSVVDLLYLLLIVLLCSWIITYKKSKKAGLYVILFCLLTTLLVVINNNHISNLSSMLMCPLFVWLIFATMLNYTEVNQA